MTSQISMTNGGMTKRAARIVEDCMRVRGGWENCVCPGLAEAPAFFDGEAGEGGEGGGEEEGETQGRGKEAGLSADEEHFAHLGISDRDGDYGDADGDGNGGGVDGATEEGGEEQGDGENEGEPHELAGGHDHGVGIGGSSDEFGLE